MKRLWLLLALLLLPLCASAEDYDLRGVTLTVTDGVVTAIKTESGALSMDGVYVDVGCDGAFVQNTIGHQRFWNMNTWDLARIVPKAQKPFAANARSARLDGDALVLTHEIEGLSVHLTYQNIGCALKLSAEIASSRSYVSEIQGVHVQVRGMRAPDGTTFRFPGNTPGGVFSSGSVKPFAVRQTDYCNPLTVFRFGENSGVNVLFLDAEEKWSCGVYSDREGGLCVSNLAMAEGLLMPGETMRVGDLYIQLTGEDAYAPVQTLYAALGYRVPETGYQSGPMYSCHPAGTMDSGFRDVKTMRAYADSLPALAKMGVESVWILPIFEHTGRGVYEPTDQRLIDPRYGGDADVRHYVDAAHDLGIRVLFDYVPHGPFPQDALVLENGQWCSVARDGQKQIEWDCVSFDMANPSYQAYTKDLIMEHVARFSVDGGRIDCAMGGLSNWKPQAGNRASSSGLKGGLGIVSAIREGFELGGKTPLLLPENFHPVPFYASVTDVFYDMPLYRLMHDMRGQGYGEEQFARALSDWLACERLASVPGQLKLRFLGNHDTVSWTWDRMRATAIYGEAKAKALWTLMSLIDGVPFLYMGDENSDLYHFRGGYDLTEFFTSLFAARRQWLADDMDTVYLPCEAALIGFVRESSDARRLALVNLGKTPTAYALPSGTYAILYGDGTLEPGMAHLPAYGCLLLSCDP